MVHAGALQHGERTHPGIIRNIWGMVMIITFSWAENSDEPLYCVQMRNPFVSGTNTVKNMSDLMDENTIKSVSAGLYYFDQNANGLSPKQKEQASSA